MNRDVSKRELLQFPGAGKRNMAGASYSSDDDLSFLAVDAEHQMAKFLAKTLRVCGGLVVLTYCTLGQRLLLSLKM